MKKDKHIWRLSPSGEFLVKAFHRALEFNQGLPTLLLGQAWFPLVWRFFYWPAIVEKMHIANFMWRRGIHSENISDTCILNRSQKGVGESSIYSL